MEQEKILSIRMIIILFVFIVLIPMSSLLISWQWDWWQAWFYFLVNLIGFVVSRLIASRRHPDLILERSQYLNHHNYETWDKRLSPLLGLSGGLIPLVAGLDARFGSRLQLGLPLVILAAIIILIGYALGSYALIENRFFSGMVRIQSERGQHVITSGPYRWVRHPGYTGAFLTYITTPLLFESGWTVFPVISTIIIIIVRTALEDRTLKEKLEGYQAYAHKVPYRLFPGLW
jgi:protein-S-isoprenylcysteine O-methyltransferase Ste14